MIQRVKFYHPRVYRAIQLAVVHIALAIFIGGSVLLAYWLWAPFNPPFILLEARAVPEIIPQGAPLVIYRKYEVFRNTTASVYRDVYGLDNNLVWNRTPYVNLFHAGVHEYRYVSELPQLPPGRYVQQTQVEIKINPIRTERIPLPPVLFTVVKAEIDK